MPVAVDALSTDRERVVVGIEFRRHYPYSSFVRNAMLMVSGTLAAQVVLLGTLPLFTRLYSPEAFGIQALFLSWTAALGVLGTLRLDLATVLPQSHEDASLLVRLVALQSTLVCLGLTVIVWLWGTQIQSFFGLESGDWLWLVGPMCVCIAILQSSVGLATRSAGFGKVTMLNTTTSVVFAGGGLALWAIDIRTDGLVVARLVAQCAGVALAAYFGLLRPHLTRRPRLTWRRARTAYRNNRQFLIFNTPYSLVGAVASDFPLLILSIVGSPASAAFYGLAKTLLVAPTTFISAALSQVFYKEAVDHLGQPRLESLARRMFWATLMFGLPPFALVTVWGDQLFSIAFGARWQPAGVVAMILSPALWLCLQTGWMQRLFEAARAQRVSFRIQMSFDAAVIVCLLATLILSGEILLAVTVYAILFASNNIVYLLGAVSVAGFSRGHFARLLGLASVSYMTLVLMGFGIRYSGFPASATAAGTCILLVSAYSVIVHMWRRQTANGTKGRDAKSG